MEKPSCSGPEETGKRGTMLDYNIESDRYACFLRWYVTKFVWKFFGPLAIIGVLLFLYCLLFGRVPHGVEKAEIEQQETEATIKECERRFRY